MMAAKVYHCPRDWLLAAAVVVAVRLLLPNYSVKRHQAHSILVAGPVPVGPDPVDSNQRRPLVVDSSHRLTLADVANHWFHSWTTVI
jgi:hypothetical protein